MEEEKKAKSENKSEAKSKVSKMPVMGKVSPMILGLVGAGVLVVVLLLVVVMFVGGSSDDGKDIPGDWEEYEADDFTFGYPEDNWEVSGSGNTATVTLKQEDSSDDSEDFDFGSLKELSVTVSVSDITEDKDGVTVDDIRGQKCSKLDDKFKEEMEDTLGSDIDFKTEKASINGLKGCKVEVGLEIFGITSDQTMFLLVDKGDDDKGYTIQVSSAGDNSDDDIEEALEIAKTVKAN